MQLLHVIICVCFIIMAQNTEEWFLMTVGDILNKSIDNKSSVLLNTYSDNYSKCGTPANEESMGKHQMFHKLNFPSCCLQMSVNSGSNLLHFCYFRPILRIITWNCWKWGTFQPTTMKESQNRQDWYWYRVGRCGLHLWYCCIFRYPWNEAGGCLGWGMSTSVIF